MDDRSLRSLPLYRDVPELPKTPKVDEVRKRLGGRQGTGPRVGRVVRVPMGSGLVSGVILAESEERCDVWVTAGTMRRVHPAEAMRFDGEVSRELRTVASDITVFASLAEGQRVVANLRGDLTEVTLAEKCMFGAIVIRDDDMLMGVGFRMLAPAGGSAC